MRVRYQPHVRARLREIFLYIGQDGPRPVIRFRARLATAQRRVSLFPLSGSKVPEWPEKPLREFLIGEYASSISSMSGGAPSGSSISGTAPSLRSDQSCRRPRGELVGCYDQAVRYKVESA